MLPLLLVGSYPTFSPLVQQAASVVFFSVTIPSQTSSISEVQRPVLSGLSSLP